MILDKLLDRLSAREKIGLLVSVICLFAWVADNRVVEPMVRRMKQLGMEVKEEKSNLAIDMAVLSHSQSALTEYEGIRKALGESSPLVGTEMKDEISELARQNGVELPSMEDREAIKKDFCAEYVVQIAKFETDIKSLLGFLNAVQTSPGMLRVMRLSLAPAQVAGHVKGSMVITKLVLLEPQKTTGRTP